MNGPAAHPPDAARLVDEATREDKIMARLAGVAGVARLPSEEAAGVLLSEVLRAERIEVNSVLALALQLANIVGAMHAAGVIHRDINPAHILLSGPRRQPMLTGFRLATTFSEGQPVFTHHHDIPGTLAYLAPEQTGRTGRTVDQRSDLYALGATLYELACGRPPFQEADPLQLIHDHLARLPTPPAELEPRLPQALSDIILRLLEKEPDRRYQSADGLAYDLAWLHQVPGQGSGKPFRLGERDFASRLSPPSRLIGRAPEISALRRAMDDALRGDGRVVLVAGAPGVGKTSLINELRPMVTAQRGWFVGGKFDQYRRDAPSATIQGLRALGRLLLAEPEAELARQRARILQFVGSNVSVLTAAVPEFALLLGPQPDAPAIESSQLEPRSLLTTLDLLRAMVSVERPLVIVLDDLQWCHPISIRFVEAVMTAQPLPGLLLVCALRDADVEPTHPLSAALPRWTQLEPAPVLLRLANLPPGDLGAMLAEMLRMPTAQAATLAQAIEPHTGGNPYDTVELVNALRRDDALVPGPDGWQWDDVAVRRYIGQGNVVDLLGARITRLPPQGYALLQAVACLGGEISMSLLRAATGLSAAELEGQLAAPLEDGLLLLHAGEDAGLRLSHDRVQQAAYGALLPAERRDMHLGLARRLSLEPAFAAVAAAQYVPVLESLTDADERRRVAHLLHQEAALTRCLYNYATVERFLAAAMKLLDGLDTGADQQLRAALEIELHAALYSLGRLDEADAVYRSIESRGGDAMDRIEPACVQVSSLTNRKQPREAVNLGLAMLRQLGLAVPIDDIGGDVARRLDEFCQWVQRDTLEDDLKKNESHDPRVALTVKLITRLMSPAVFCDHAIVAWLAMESQRLWTEHGPSAAVIGLISGAPFVTISLRQDYRTGYSAVRRVLAVGRARGYEPGTSLALFRFALYCAHWFEPLDESTRMVRQAREGLLRAGELQTACLTHYASIAALLDCAPVLHDTASDIEAGLAFATRTSNDYARAVFLPQRQLVRVLSAPTAPPGSFTDSAFDEASRLKCTAAGPAAVANFHFTSALGCALFSDLPGVIYHVAAGLPSLPYQHSMYGTMMAHLLQVLALAERIKGADHADHAELLRELDRCRDWLALRAADCPVNFLHLLRLVEAERAWSVGDCWSAACAFDAALREAQGRRRPWHLALITERAGIFHMSQGLELAGAELLEKARGHYQAWGATAKVRQLEQTWSFLRAPLGAERDAAGSTISADAIDTLAILRVSQALSSETSLAQLKAKVVDLLGTLTGATTVRFALWHEDAKDWFVSVVAGTEPVSVGDAGARGQLPLSAFRYAERTREPLLVDDATRDDRFARDPYIAGLRHCSLLIVPILNQGVARAVLLLENNLSRDAFSTERLDAVMLIAGQLAVSLENALLYERLDERVREQTRALRDTQVELVTAARQAGMAEIATNVLHNVGNVLNNVNVSASLVGAQLRQSKLKGLGRAVRLMDEHSGDLGEFITRDAKGKLLPGFLRELAQALESEHQAMANELTVLGKSVDHIKEVVAIQQSYAGNTQFVESVKLAELVDDALRLNADRLARHSVEVVKDFGELPLFSLNRHRVLQILVNLIDNANIAMAGISDRTPRITLGAGLADEHVLRITVADNGEGILPENLTRIFSHGFTTRKNGHGFGLHSCALAAQEMGGSLSAHSDGAGLGATFTLQLLVGELRTGEQRAPS